MDTQAYILTAPAHARWGFAPTEALRAVVKSARVMEKAGLVREGILRRWLIHPNISGYPRDCYSYAVAR